MINNIIWRLWYGEYLLEELRGSRYVANIHQMREYVENLKDNWTEFAKKRNGEFKITEDYETKI